jgi:hypothetical protein
MGYDFDYYGGKDLDYPNKPTKPRLSAVPTAAEARAYADGLEAYEIKLKEYRAGYDDYTRSLNGRLDELKTRLRDEYAITDAQMHLLWARAWDWDDGHSEGLRRVVEIFNELYDIASQFAALEKG